MRRHLLIIQLLLLALYCSAQGYKNPVISGMAPDPSVCRVGNDYYLVTSSFIQNPALPIYHSNDLINWELINYAVTDQNGLDLSKGVGMFAPTIRYNEHDSTFYVICTNVGCGQNFIVHAKHPDSTWSNPVFLTNPRIGIDPSLFWTDDGACYLQCTGDNNIIQICINPKTGEELSSFHYLTDGLGGRYPEGPHIYKRGDYYYLMISEGGTEFGHHVNLFRSDDIWGPYMPAPNNPILSHVGKNAQNNPIQCTGHADLIEAHDGSWWMVFLGTRPIGEFYPLGRETFLAPVEWNDKGWLTVNGNGTVSEEMNVKTLPQSTKKSVSQRKNPITFVNGFSHNIPEDWNAYRVSPQTVAKITPEGLEIKASNTYDAFVGTRQLDYYMDVELKLEIADWEGEAGLCVHHDDGKRYNIALVRENGQAFVKSECLFNSVNQVKTTEIDSKTHVIYLKISSQKELYKFYWKYADNANGQAWTEIGQMDAQYLAGGFSGLLVGPYVAKGKAVFTWFTIKYK
ncbi:MAG: family 43 glycosylhydrolase [Bacteroidales bacterium]|nr:family 43 glycosylhydrolase [Bacteroidales bacterium]